MIRIKIDLIRHGDRSQATPLGQIELTNLGKRPDGTADFAYMVAKAPPFANLTRRAWDLGKLHRGVLPKAENVDEYEDEQIRIGKVRTPHREISGVYEILYRVLAAARGPEADRIAELEAENARLREELAQARRS
ncbi:MAG: hypothetical protein H6888_10320 [Nitratireductor sp.]|nr:hypothetical protein [Nitratireductor sp.]